MLPVSKNFLRDRKKDDIETPIQN